MRAMLEITPPSRRATEQALSSFISNVRDLARSVKHVDYLSVPEIVEENFAGMPLYKHVDVCEFAAKLRGAASIEVMINKISVHLESEQRFRAWVANTISAYNIHNIILVGGNRTDVRYHGPAVVRANEIAREVVGLNIGNICIPSREGEMERLIAKTQSGASFFTTQLLLEPDSVNKLMLEYSSRCAAMKLRPAEFFISIAPASNNLDIDFFKWLGVQIPQETEKRLRNSNDIGAESIEMATGLFSEIRNFVKDQNLKVPVSVNVETISSANLGLACQLLNSVQTPAA